MIKLVESLFGEQLAEWPLAKQNYEAPNKVQVRDLDLGGCSVRIQFNPERMRSSAAKIDAKSIQERKCFLCPAHLPAEQRGSVERTGRTETSKYPEEKKSTEIP